MGRPVRVVIAYRAPLFVLGLRSLLEERSEVVVVGATSERRALVAIAAVARPDVVIVEPLTPSAGELLTRQLLALDPPPRVVVVDEQRNGLRNARRAARRAGAHGSVTRDASIDELVAELMRVAGAEARTAA